MHPFLNFFIRVFLLLIIGIIIIKPYNIYCSTTGKCSGINLIEFIPDNKFKEGIGSYHLEFINLNPNIHLDISSDFLELSTVSGRKNVVTYTIKNISKTDKDVKFKLKFKTDPSYEIKRIKVHECLCNKTYKLKPGREMIKKFIFTFKEEPYQTDKVKIIHEIEYLN